MNSKVQYRYRTVDNDSTVSRARSKVNEELDSLNVYAEVRGKYSRPINNMESIALPLLKSRGSQSITSRKQTSSSFNSKNLADFEVNDEKDLQELQKLLRQERLVIFIQRRLRAERELKKMIERN